MLSSSDSISDGRLLQRAWSPVVTVFDLQVQSDGRRGPETSITSRMPQRISSRRSSSQVRSLLKYHGPPPPPSSLTREAAKEERRKKVISNHHIYMNISRVMTNLPAHSARRPFLHPHASALWKEKIQIFFPASSPPIFDRRPPDQYQRVPSTRDVRIRPFSSMKMACAGVDAARESGASLTLTRKC